MSINDTIVSLAFVEAISDFLQHFKKLSYIYKKVTLF